MEALVCHPLGTEFPIEPCKNTSSRLQNSRYYQSPHAAVSTGHRAGCTFYVASVYFRAPTNLQLQAKPRGFVRTGVDIVKKETGLGLYKGLGAVLGGIIPKMAIRFTSYESYKQMLADKNTGAVTSKATFLGTDPIKLILLSSLSHANKRKQLVSPQVSPKPSQSSTPWKS